MECQCEMCQGACKFKPGWFLPEQIAKVAEHLKLTEKELFDKYLGVDFYQRDGEDIFILAPANKSMKPGAMYPFDPRGECIFFEDGLCKIHAVKPLECAEYDHTKNKEDIVKIHEEKIPDAWISKQEYVRQLYKNELNTEYENSELFQFMGEALAGNVQTIDDFEVISETLQSTK